MERSLVSWAIEIKRKPLQTHSTGFSGLRSSGGIVGARGKLTSGE